jgi:hypothetical protein
MINRPICTILCMIMKRHCDLNVEKRQAQCRNSHKHVEKSRCATSEHCCRRGYSSDSCSMLSMPPYARARSTKVNRMRDLHYALYTMQHKQAQPHMLGAWGRIHQSVQQGPTSYQDAFQRS